MAAIRKAVLVRALELAVCYAGNPNLPGSRSKDLFLRWAQKDLDLEQRRQKKRGVG